MIENSMSSINRPWHVLTLSGATGDALDDTTAKLLTYLSSHPTTSLAHVAYTLQSERIHGPHRRVVLCRTVEDALQTLNTSASRQVLVGVRREAAPKITFMFPGLGDQYVNMTAQLYQEEPIFRRVIDQCSEQLIDPLGLDLREVIYSQDESAQPEIPPSGPLDLKQMIGRGEPQRDLGHLKETSVAQPALFVIEYALAELWRSWGIKPAAMVGYSLGEYVAAVQAGVFSREDGLQIVAQRAQLINALPAGAMLAVGLPEEAVRNYLNPMLSISAINGPLMGVIAGAVEAVAALEERLTAERIACRRVHTTHAFHSYMMQPATTTLTALVQRFTRNFPQIPFVSNVTGRWMTPQQASDAAYWAEHLCQPVRFADAVETLWTKPNMILLEVGLGQTLSGLAMQHPARRAVENPLIVPSLPSSGGRSTQTPNSERFHLLRALAQLWIAGVEVDWQGVHKGKPPFTAVDLIPALRQQMKKEAV